MVVAQHRYRCCCETRVICSCMAASLPHWCCVFVAGLCALESVRPVEQGVLSGAWAWFYGREHISDAERYEWEGVRIRRRSETQVFPWHCRIGNLIELFLHAVTL